MHSAASLRNCEERNELLRLSEHDKRWMVPPAQPLWKGIGAVRSIHADHPARRLDLPCVRLGRVSQCADVSQVRGAGWGSGGKNACVQARCSCDMKGRDQ